MSWFKKSILNVTIGVPAGEWAVAAMACMAFADAQAEAAEVEARRVVAVNPVIANSIGSERGVALFDEAVRAIATDPPTMLASAMSQLQAQAAKITSKVDRNFALMTVFAIITADEIKPGEHAMLLRLKEIVGAEVEVPPLG